MRRFLASNSLACNSLIDCDILKIASGRAEREGGPCSPIVILSQGSWLGLAGLVGDPSSIVLGRTSTQRFKTIVEKVQMVRLSRLLAYKDVKIVGTSDPYQLGNVLLGNPLTNERETQ